MCEGKYGNGVKLMALGHRSGGPVCNKAINFSFPAPFFGSFFGRAKNEQIKSNFDIV
jgi:hypothetical protein